jgi:hypothetical protein
MYKSSPLSSPPIEKRLNVSWVYAIPNRRGFSL